MSRYLKLGKNVALLSIGNFASKILGFLLVPFYTAVLSTEEYGISDLISTTIALLSPIFTLLINEATIRFALDKNEDKKQIFTISSIVVLAGFIVMLLFSPLIRLTALREYYWYFVLYFLVSNIHTMIMQFVKGIEHMVVYTITGLLETILFIVCNLIFLLGFDMGIQGYLMAYIISSFCSSLFLFFKEKMWNYVCPIKKIDVLKVREMLRYAIPMIPNSLGWWISTSSDKYILGFFSGITAVGIYSVSYKIPSILSIVTSIFLVAWQISAVEGFGTSDFNKFYSDIYKRLVEFLAIITALLVLLAKPLGSILFSEDFFQAWLYTPVLVMAYMFSALSGFLGTVYTSSKKSERLFFSSMIGAVGNIILNIILIPFWGAMGAAVATLLSYFVMYVVRLIDTVKIMRIKRKYELEIIISIILTFEMIVVCLDLKYSLVLALFLTILLMVYLARDLKLLLNEILQKLKQK